MTNPIVGDRIRLLKMGDDDPHPIPPGATGTVIGTCPGIHDGTTQVSVKWDPEVGRSLSLLLPVDAIEVIDT